MNFTQTKVQIIGLCETKMTKSYLMEEFEMKVHEIRTVFLIHYLNHKHAVQSSSLRTEIPDFSVQVNNVGKRKKFHSD